MFKILLIVTFMAFGFPQQGELTISAEGSQSKSCSEELNTEGYKNFRDSKLKELENMGAEDITIIKEECTDLNRI